MSISKLNIYETPQDLAKSFAAVLHHKIAELLANDQTISIALSGGNTPKALFKTLATEYKNKINWNAVNFYWVDERCVPPDDKESNFGNAYRSLFSKINISPSCIHRIRGEAIAEAEAERYRELVKLNVKQKDSLPCFDIILLGLGADGHTASIFPGSTELFNSPDIYAVSEHPETKQKRITLTGNTINNADLIYFLVSGSDKAKVFRLISNKDEDAKVLPAALINPVRGDICWFIDSKAAGV